MISINIRSTTQGHQNSSGCPVCSGHKLWSGHNDFETWCKKNNMNNLLSEWNYEENGNLLPSMIFKSSHVKVWWKCRTCKYEWETYLDTRTNSKNHTGCPICSRKGHMKQVRCIETNYVYNSFTEASEQTGIDRSGICACCKGRQKSAGGYHWEYFNK